MRFRRITLAVIVLSLIILLSAYYYTNHEMHEEYPDNEDVVEGFKNGVVSVHGFVINRTDGGFYILIEYRGKERVIEVMSDLDVGRDDRVEVLGYLKDDRIFPEKIIVYRKWSYYSIFIRSAIAIPIVLYFFFKYWRFDFGEMMFRRRNL